ncbi:MAG: hypothetical protein IJ574_04260 [Bacilli bacterium]|nr:hypothetical protein [Bacilli bacterium]
MNPESIISKGISIPKIISGLGKTLSVANRVIPLYKQAKPMVQNAKKAFNILKEFKNTSTTSNEFSKNIAKKVTATPIKNTANSIKPRFFQ